MTSMDPIVQAVAATLRKVAEWGEIGRDELYDIARAVEALDDDFCCPLCEEVDCDEDCPLAQLRQHLVARTDRCSTDEA